MPPAECRYRSRKQHLQSAVGHRPVRAPGDQSDDAGFEHHRTRDLPATGPSTRIGHLLGALRRRGSRRVVDDERPTNRATIANTIKKTLKKLMSSRSRPCPLVISVPVSTCGSRRNLRMLGQLGLADTWISHDSVRRLSGMGQIGLRRCRNIVYDAPPGLSASPNVAMPTICRFRGPAWVAPSWSHRRQLLVGACYRSPLRCQPKKRPDQIERVQVVAAQPRHAEQVRPCWGFPSACRPCRRVGHRPRYCPPPRRHPQHR